ncbi:MAG: prolyl oligopeptidase family serine peptidase [Leptospiraceae bacterium]|nr:prolyl oligopeptidase family serine peptidase [Leptospiraceae bacterium]
MKRLNSNFILRLILISLFCIFICPMYSEKIEIKSGIQTICIPKLGDTVTVSNPPCANAIPVDIYTPESKQVLADVLVLNGWNFPRDDWQKKTRIIKSAKEQGFRLIFPEMGKTNYESDYFPETTLKWSTTPGGKWVREILIPTLQKNGILLKTKRNFVMGLSTGGRGAAILGFTQPEIFTAAASVSGDFDQSTMPKDRLMTGSYGKYEDNKERWETVDNVYRNAKDWKIPIYLGHGQKDKVSPFIQTKNFYLKLKELHPNLKIVFNDPQNAEHDYKYWDSEVDPIFQFFSGIR